MASNGRNGWHESVLELIGGTPMVRLKRIVPAGSATILAKLEYTNPSGSLKDRIAVKMLEEAERRGDLKPGMRVVEPTSGNTGAGVALACAMKGYQMVAVMPEAMSMERAMLIKALGAELVLTKCKSRKPGLFTREDIERVIDTAVALSKKPGYYMPNQFENPDNPVAHTATAEEIWKQTGGRVDALVMGVGTSGTLMGVGRWLRKRGRPVKVVAVEPANSAVLVGCEPGPHKLQGIGEGFVPKLYDKGVVDEVVPVTDQDAKLIACRLAREEGIIGGYSGGANVFTALKIAKRLGAGKFVVTFIPDSGLKYLSTDLFRPDEKTCRACRTVRGRACKPARQLVGV